MERSRLSYIVFLHQTTTCGKKDKRKEELSYIVFLHQTTTVILFVRSILILSYIVFLHQTTTYAFRPFEKAVLSYIVFLHQTTTFRAFRCKYKHCLISSFYIKPQLAYHISQNWIYCLISSFYIKPQPSTEYVLCHHIVLYRLSTSNHNKKTAIICCKELSYIVFLHQTTTVLDNCPQWNNCLISSFYIKPQLSWLV